MSLPLSDWQFWAVSAAFAGALLWMLRGVMPWSAKRRRARPRRATLTVKGRAIDPPPQPKR